MSDETIDLTSTVVLGDGSTATIRPILPSDGEALRGFHERQSYESNYTRYFSPKPTLTDAEVERFTNVDMVDRAAYVVEQHGEFIAWASYERWKGRPDAEVAFQVDDAHQGKGIATLLLEHLAATARSNGIERFTAETLGSNGSMITVFSKAGWPLQRRFESGVVDVEFPLDDSDDFLDSVDRREQRADSRAMARLLIPRSIAVVGASSTPNTIGQALWAHTAHNSRVPVIPVNPHHDSVDGIPSVARVCDIDPDVDLAIIAVPTAELAGVIDDCIAKRVRGAVLVTAPDDEGPTVRPRLDSAGDVSGDGPDHEGYQGGYDITPLVRHARRNGLRIIGPASMGIASPLPGVAINATLVNVTLRPGSIAISTQSGTLGASVLRLGRDLDIGLSWFVSLGDKGDVSSNDLLQFWEDDEATKVICLYTESVGNPRKFARMARRASLRRPIIVVRTGAAMGGLGTDAMYRRSGVIEVPTVQAMLDTARVMVSQPLMTGDRVAVVSNARSPRIAAEAALSASGLEVVAAPVQLAWHATPADYAAAIDQARADANINALIVIHTPPSEDADDATSESISDALEGAEIPALTVMFGSGDGPLVASKPDGIASFAFPEQAAAVLSRLRAYSMWRETESPQGRSEPTGIRRQHATELIADYLAQPDYLAQHGDDTADGGDTSETAAPTDTVTTPSNTPSSTPSSTPSGTPSDSPPTPEMVRDLLSSYGIDMPLTRLVRAEDAVAAANEIGYPVAVKAVERIAGSSVRAGIGLDLTNADAVADAVAEMGDALGDGAAEVWVQAMVAPGPELRATARIDDAYGPIVSTGLGGFDADVVDDVSSRIAPIVPSAARNLLAETRASGALDTDGTNAMVDLLVRLAELVSDHPEIEFFDLNPIIVSGSDTEVVDAVLHLRPAPRVERPIRRLEVD